MTTTEEDDGFPESAPAVQAIFAEARAVWREVFARGVVAAGTPTEEAATMATRAACDFVRQWWPIGAGENGKRVPGGPAITAVLQQMRTLWHLQDTAAFALGARK